jgi:ATPase family associated with various cellular activities (AAA)
MGKVYYDMGFLATAEVVESSATDLVGQYVGHTGPKTQKLLEKALGKVLFIDEAYRLAEGNFAKEAMDEIVDSITKPKFAQKLIIILAGYDADINRLMSINPGLTSRFPETVTFRGLNPEESAKLFTQLLQKQKSQLHQRKRDLDIAVLESPPDEFLRKLLYRLEALLNLPNWANARDVETLAKGVFGKTIKTATLSQGKLMVSEETIIAEIDSMIAERAHRSHIPALDQHSPLPDGPQAVFDNRFDSPPAAQTTRSAKSISQNDRPPSPPPSRDIQAAPDETPRDAGVSDEEWERLQQDKGAAEARKQDYKRLLEQEAALQESTAALEEAAQREAEEATRHEAEEVTQREADEAKRRHEEARLQHELERRAREAELEALKRKRQAEEERRRKEREVQKKLRELGVCCMGFQWIKQACGYRCAGGSHYVSNAELGLG